MKYWLIEIYLLEYDLELCNARIPSILLFENLLWRWRIQLYKQSISGSIWHHDCRQRNHPSCTWTPHHNWVCILQCILSRLHELRILGVIGTKHFRLLETVCYESTKLTRTVVSPKFKSANTKIFILTRKKIINNLDSRLHVQFIEIFWICWKAGKSIFKPEPEFYVNFKIFRLMTIPMHYK